MNDKQSDSEIIQEYYEELSHLTDEELLEKLKNDSQNKGWVHRRMLYMTAHGKVLRERRIAGYMFDIGSAENNDFAKAT